MKRSHRSAGGGRFAARTRWAASFALMAIACVPSASMGPKTAAPPVRGMDDSARIREFVAVEEGALEWLSAADPRLAMRTGVAAPDTVLATIGMEAVVAEDATAVIHGSSLDLFAFRARLFALDHAAKLVAGFTEMLPENGLPDSPLSRPRLERELLARLIEEERQRALDEGHLGDASGDLVRGILSTWAPLANPQEWPLRDAWVSQHLAEMRDALRSVPVEDGPFDLDVALYPLERLLSPLAFPRGAAAIAQLRVVMDQDMRNVAPLAAPARIAHLAAVHLGLRADAPALVVEFSASEARLRDQAERALSARATERHAIEERARELLFVEGRCPTVSRTRVRTLEPPPERAAICGAVRALVSEGDAVAALVALHDDVLLALSAVTTSPPPRTRLLSNLEDDRVDDIRRAARERPVVAIGLARAAELAYGADDDAASRIQSWSALGDAPLDVVAREMR